jgi:hypothetical protein
MTNTFPHTARPSFFSRFGFLHAHLGGINVVLMGMVIVFAVCYVIQANGAVASGYRIRELEDRIQTLTMEQQQLEVSSRKLQSLDQVERSVKMLGLVPAEQPTYLESGVPSMAFVDAR